MNMSAEVCLQTVMSLSMTELFGGDGIPAIGDEVSTKLLVVVQIIGYQ
jgi:hypothetical protein